MGDSFGKTRGGSSGPILAKLKKNTAPLVYAGTTVRHTDNIEVTRASTADAYQRVELKRYRIPVSGTIKLQFDAKITGSQANSAINIYKNKRSALLSVAGGVTTKEVEESFNANGSEINTAYNTFTAVIGVNAGDEISINHSATNTGVTVYITNVKIMYDDLAITNPMQLT